MTLARSPRVTALLARLREARQEAALASVPARTLGRLGLLGPPLPSSLTNTFRNDFALSPIRVELRQLIVDGGRILARIQEARAMADSLGHQARADWQKLDMEVRLAYVDALRAAAAERLALESLDTVRLHLRIAEKRFAAGKAPRADILVAQVPVCDAELEIVQTRARSVSAIEALNLLLGLPLDTPLQLQDVEDPPPLAATLESCLEAALHDRPDLMALRAEATAAGKGEAAARLESHPQVNLLVGAAAQSDNVHAIGSFGYLAGFEFTWLFLDGGKQRALVRQARAHKEWVAARLDAATRDVEQQVRQTLRDVEVAEEARRVRRVQLQHAQEALRVSVAQYDAGYSPFYPVRESQLELARARQADLKSRYDQVIARARLDQACGRSPVDLVVPGPTP